MKTKVDINIQGVSRAQAEAYARDPKNRYIVAIPILLLASFLFYILSAFFSYASGSSESLTLEESIMQGVADYNAADTFQKIQMALRVMPSQKTEGNMLLMTPSSGQAEWQADYDSDFTDGITDDFFITDSMRDYFPDLTLNENTVPIGSSKPFCLHLDWSTKANRKMLDRYYQVQDMPLCQMAQNPKVLWQSQDPKTGIDFMLWK